MLTFLVEKEKNTRITLEDFSKDNMSTIEPFGFHGREEELTAVSVFTWRRWATQK